MFYFLVAPILVYNWVLILAAVIPAIFLLVKVYKSDRAEKESPRLLRRLVIAGILATLIAMIAERIGERVLSWFASTDSSFYQVVLYFVVVAVSEECAKYFLMKRITWENPEFNSQYDGVVYAVFVSLGFALWENINYVLSFGFSTAIVRALTAIPGHACFGVYMGVFYGMARYCQNSGYSERAKTYRFLSVLVPVLLHGAYDYIATVGSTRGGIGFAVFILALFGLSFRLVRTASERDRPI